MAADPIPTATPAFTSFDLRCSLASSLSLLSAISNP
jgi:hypothetical protein